MLSSKLEVGAEPHVMNLQSKYINLTFENLTYSVSTSLFSKKKKYILKGVSGCFKAGELTAIMGPSGAGKSSLLNVISGFIKENVSGSVFANGELLDSKRSGIKCDTAYLLQDDHLNPFFTVNETMKYAADLKLGYSASDKSKYILIEDILDSMAMGQTQDTLCSKLSGGQRKRLNVCLELINNPSIIYLDEPTSGLDSSSCSLLVSKLKELARSGRTVICTIHQPSASVLSMFHHLYVLYGGRTVYQGDVTNLLPFLEYIALPCPVFHNPADFMMDVVSGEFGDHTNSLLTALKSKDWREDKPQDKLPENKEVVRAINNYNKEDCPSELTKYAYMLPKFGKQMHRDWKVSYLKFILHMLVGLITGLLYLNMGPNGAKVFNNVGYMFCCIFYSSFTAMMPAALKFPSEILVLKKEHFNNWYKFTTYYLAFLTVNIPLQLLMMVPYQILAYVLSGQAMELQRIMLYLCAIAFNVVISEFIGLFMGTLKHPVNGVFSGSILLATFALVSGFVVFLKDMPHYMRIASNVGYFRFIFEILVLSQYGMNRGKLDCPSEEMYCFFRKPERLTVDMIGLEEDNLMSDVVILSGYTLLTGIITFYKLRFRLKNFH